MNYKKIFFFLAIFFSCVNIFSQPAKEWVNRYNGPGNSFDIVSKSIIDNQSNIYVYGSSVGTGTLTDFTIIKYSNAGNELWVERYNGAGNGTDQINSACQDKYGNSYVSGFTSDSDNSINLTSAKFDSSGKLVWLKIFRDNSISNCYGQDIVLDSSGNVIICGASRNNFTGRYTIIIVAYNNDGILLNNVAFDESSYGDNIPVKINTDNLNNLIIAGSVTSSQNNKDMIVLKYSSSLSLLWSKTVNGTANSDDYISDILTDENNEIYLCGSIKNISTSSDYYYAKLNSEGITVWYGTYSSFGNNKDIPSSIAIDSLYNTYITGFTQNDSVFRSEDILTLKISPAGVRIWEAQYNGSANGIDLGNSVTADIYGNVYIGGSSERAIFQNKMALLKYNSSGILQWFQDYSVTNPSEDFVYDVILDKENNIFITGISMGAGTDYDITTIKYSQKTGINNLFNIIPVKSYLLQNYPNPFNPGTVISYQLDAINNVSIKIYDILGKGIATLVNEKQNAGNYKIGFDGSNLPSGIYFYSLLVDGNNIDTRQMLLLK